jgi:phosphoribosylaminoimidazolecarboxamide formyltransferase/IMP cyclohydrolase
MSVHHIRRALISVFDKTGIVQLANSLQEAGVEIISTGGTAKALRDAGIAVVELSDYTGFPEMLDGRVKTLHPKIHGGLLYIRGNAEHEHTVAEHKIGAIDLVVVNLYPFEETVKSGATRADIIEKIDIGGPSMIRSAAKNHASVAVVVDTQDYQSVADEIVQKSGLTQEMRTTLAGKAFARTAEYDAAIAAYFAQDESISKTEMPETLTIHAPLAQKLRYGENPHQRAALYGNFYEYYKQLQGKELSYNNILDLTAAAELITEFTDDASTVAILKHTNPCGVGQAIHLRDAWQKAFETDKQAPFGGIIAINVELDVETANAIKEIFCEVIVAPSFSADALAILSEKKNIRLIQLLKDPRAPNAPSVRSVGAESYVVQDADIKSTTASELKVVTKRQPSKDELAAMLFAWKVAKHVKSNAIVYAANDSTLGVGAGQMSRVDSSRIAIYKAGEAGLSLKGSAIGSDAFFPFADGLIIAAQAGATAVIQPGGSIKDAEIITAADERNMTMAFTGVRLVRHGL